ncbi:hypothetical protein HFP72_21785 [Nocardiopsis sp. ARC36]
MLPRRPLARVLLALYAALSAVHLVVQWYGADGWSRPTQALLMPVLAAVLLAEAPGRAHASQSWPRPPSASPGSATPRPHWPRATRRSC